MQGRRVIPLALTIALTLAPMACASGGGGGGGSELLYREDIGRVLYQPLEIARQKIWTKHSIPLLREENAGRNLMWESHWIERTPLASELALGARNRVTMRGYQVGENLDGTGNYRMTWEVQNQIRTAATPEWHPVPFPDEVRDIFRRVYNDLMMEVRAGVRR